MVLKLFFTENSPTTSDIVKSGFTYTQNYHNNLSPADNYVKCSVPYDEDLSDLLKLHINEYVKCQIVKSDNSILFTGFLKNNVSFTKETRNKSIALEIVAGSYLLDKKFTEDHTAGSVTLKNAVTYILTDAGVSSYDVSNLPAKTLTVFSVTSDDTIKETLKTLLFEYGYTYDFDNENKCVMLPLFNLPENENSTLQAFIDGNEGNIYGTLNQTATMRSYDGVKANFNKLEYAENQLIFNDSDSHEIASNGYLYDNEIGCYTEYDSSKGAVKLITSINSWKVTGSNGDITNTNPNRNGLSGTFENSGNRGLLKVKNAGASANTVSSVQIYGTGYFVVSAEQVNTSEGNNPSEVNLKFISGNSDAEDFVANLTNYYKYSSFKLTLNSKEDFDYGSFVTVSADGMGQITGRIVQKVITLDSPMIKYTIEAVGSFNPVELEQTTNRATNNNPTIDQVSQIVEEVATPIVEEIVEPIVEEVIEPVIETKIVNVYPRYIGAYPITKEIEGQTVTITIPDNEECRIGDWYLQTEKDEQNQVHLYINTYDEETEEYSWVKVEYTPETDYMFTSASKDILNYTSDSGEVGQFATLFVSHLFAQKITVTESIESENYSEENGTGFKFDGATGNIYGNNGEFRGIIGEYKELATMEQISGTDKWQVEISLKTDQKNTTEFDKNYTLEIFLIPENNLGSNIRIKYLGTLFITENKKKNRGDINIFTYIITASGSIIEEVKFEVIENETETWTEGTITKILHTEYFKLSYTQSNYGGKIIGIKKTNPIK